MFSFSSSGYQQIVHCLPWHIITNRNRGVDEQPRLTHILAVIYNVITKNHRIWDRDNHILKRLNAGNESAPLNNTPSHFGHFNLIAHLKGSGVGNNNSGHDVRDRCC